MKLLYERMDTLPVSLQMFMTGCPPELDALRDRINCRQIVSRNLWALAHGVRRTVCWNLAPEVGNYEDPFTMMELMHGKLPLLAYEDGRLGRRRPAADSFRRLAAELDGARSVMQIAAADDPGIRAFEVDRPGRGPLAVLWRDGDLVTGERVDQAAIEWPWPHDAVAARDALGERASVSLGRGRARVALSVTPVFLTAGEAAWS